MKRWPLTLRGTGAAVLGVLCFALAHEFKVTELLYVSVLLTGGRRCEHRDALSDASQ